MKYAHAIVSTSFSLLAGLGVLLLPTPTVSAADVPVEKADIIITIDANTLSLKGVRIVDQSQGGGAKGILLSNICKFCELGNDPNECKKVGTPYCKSITQATVHERQILELLRTTGSNCVTIIWMGQPREYCS
jgi:hypothetical protein